MVAGLWAELEEDRERLLVEFELVEPVKPLLPDGVPIPPEFQHRRPMLPPRLLEDRLPPDPLELIRDPSLAHPELTEQAQSNPGPTPSSKSHFASVAIPPLRVAC